jgi:glyoxylase-like metal-dependent hydrolase (beta-lactamase superfamily II)
MKLVRNQEFEGVDILTVGQHPMKEPKLTVNLFLVDGLLIDTGPPRLYDEVKKELNSRVINQICVTHHHEDHTGNVAKLSAHFDCPAYSSPLCAEMMKSPPKISFAQYMTWGNRPAFYGLKGIESLTTNEYEFQLIDIPGHAADMVALYEPNQKWLFSADLYVHHYISYFLSSESVSQQIQSIEKVLRLDFETLYCSHALPAKDGREKLTKKLHFLRQFEEQVSSQAAKGYSAKKIMKELNLKERWGIRIMSHGMLSTLNMVKSVLRDMKQ